MPEKSPTFRRDFALLFTVLLVVAAGNTALQSVLPSIGRLLHISDVLIAIIFSFSALLWTVAAPFWARQSDLRGRKRLVLIGLGGYVVSMTACGLAIFAGIEGWLPALAVFLFFTVARGLFGLFGSASNPAAQAYVAARTSKAERTQALATLGSAFGLGTVLGPAMAPFLILPVVGLSGPIFSFAVIALVTAITILKLLPNDTVVLKAGDGGAAASLPSIGGGPTGASAVAADKGAKHRLSWRDERVMPLMIFGFMMGSMQALTGQTLGFLIIDRTGLGPTEAAHQIGIALMAGAVATLFAQWGLIRMFHMTPRQLMRWGAAMAFAGTLITALTPDFYGIVVAFALTCMGYGFARPGFTAGASLAVGEADQGAVAGAVTAVNGSTFILAPAIGIGLYQIAQPLPFLAAAACLAALYVYAYRNRVLAQDYDDGKEEAA
ncbi:MFS transporter [Pseudokordiimonas caeni]|uniref:MFS transporter n=1 Tax=Pseudokordiimonas caeni TaxID=2997908 RepID=UPI002811EA8F|nr:MFS transporter [Pseudokordiimonas caeni]